MQKSIIINCDTLREQPELFDCWRTVIQQDARFLSNSYPSFYRWIGTKVSPGLLSGTRTAIVETRDNVIVGLLIVKHSEEEKKLCTVRVRDAFQNKGLGIRLFQKAFELLETTRPLLSVSDPNLQKFSRIFDYFGFEKESEYRGLYLPSLTEHSFNGELLSESFTPSFFPPFYKRINEGVTVASPKCDRDSYRPPYKTFVPFASSIGISPVNYTKRLRAY